MDTVDLLAKIWPLLLAFVTLVIVLAKTDNRVSVLEEKVRVLFDLWNKGRHDGK
jgi:hypothetical protein